MRVLGTIAMFAALVFSVCGVSNAIPNCSQVSSAWCDLVYPYCEAHIVWQECGVNGIRLWKCYWDGGGEGCYEGPADHWDQCWCEGFEPPGNECDCFLAGTLITMADGTTRPVAAIRVGDMVLAWDPAMGSAAGSPVTAVHPPSRTDSYIVVNRTLRMTPGQPVMADGTWMEARDLMVGTSLQTADGLRSVFSVQVITSDVVTYNIAVAADTYFADGVVVHNKEDCEDYMQYPPE